MGRNRWPLTPPAPQPDSAALFRPRRVSSSVLSPRSAAPTTQVRAIVFASRPPPSGRAQRRRRARPPVSMPASQAWQSSRAACATLMNPTSPRVVFNTGCASSSTSTSEAMQLIEPRSGARDIRAFGPSRTRCTRRSKRPSPAVAGPLRHVDFETDPGSSRSSLRCAPRRAPVRLRLAGRARPEAHRFHGGADYFIASRTTLVAGVLWARASTIVTVQGPRVTRRRSRIVMVARPWSTRP